MGMLVNIVVNFTPLIIAIVMHELAHGYVAYILGDNTAKRMKRLSLNPLRHVDILGTIILPFMLIVAQSGLVIGWAKSVPVNFKKLKNIKRDTILVASAGIVTNIFLALISVALLKLAPYISSPNVQALYTLFLVKMMVFNIIIAIFNAIPIPPLDGSKILFGWIDNPRVQKILNSEQIGMGVIFFLIFAVPYIANLLGFDFNPFSSYLSSVSQYFMSLIM